MRLLRLATAVLRGTNVEHGQIRDAVTHRRQEVVGIEVLPAPEKGGFFALGYHCGDNLSLKPHFFA